MKQSDVFISYRRQDVEFVKKLDQAIRDSGREVWVDWNDIPPGVEGFGDEIQLGIESAGAFIAVLSPGYLESEYCLMELREALRLKKRIVPVIYRKFDPQPAPDGIGHINWIYFTPHAGLENLFEESYPKVIQAIEADYEFAREHTRILLRASDWNKNQRNNGYLMKGAEIEKAESWQVKAVGKTPAVNELQSEYILISRKQQRRQQQQFTALVSGLLIVAVIAAIYALIQERAARISADIAHSSALASAALQPGNEEIAVALALEAARSQYAPPEAFSALRSVAYPVGAIRFLHKPGAGDDYSPFFAPAVSPDGKLIVMKNRLYDLSSDTLIREFENTPGIILMGRFLPDGKRVVLAGDDEGVNDPNADPIFMGLYDSGTGRLIQKFDTGIGVAYIQLSADGKTLIGYQPDNKIILWDVNSGKKIHTYDYEYGSSTIISPDLKWYVDVQPTEDGAAQELLIHDTATMDIKKTIPLEYSPLIQFSNDSKQLAVVIGSQLSTYDVRSGDLVTRFADASSGISSIKFSDDGDNLVADTFDFNIVVWSASGEIIASQTLHKTDIISIDFAHDDERIVSMDRNGLVVELDLLPGNMDPKSFSGEYPKAITPDGQNLVTESYENGKTTIHIRDTESLEELSTVVIADLPFKDFNCSDTRTVIMSYYIGKGVKDGLAAYGSYATDQDCTIISNAMTIINLETGKVVQSWDMYHSSVISPNGSELISFNEDNVFEVWDINSGEKIRDVELPLNGYSIFTNGSIFISPDGSKILFSYIPSDPATGNNQPSTTTMLDLATGKTLFTEYALNGFFTPDGSQFVTITNVSEAGKNLKLTIRDIQTYKEVRTFSINAPNVSEFQIDPSGQHLFAANSDGGGGGMDNTPSFIYYGGGYVIKGSVQQWDFKTGDFVWDFPVSSWGLVIAPDGSRIFTGSDALRSWRIDTPAQLIDWACSNRYVAEFTPEQRDHYRIETESSICKNN